MWPLLCGVSGTRIRPSAAKGEQQWCVMCFLPGVDSDGGFARSSQGLAVRRCQHCYRTHARMELILVGHSSRQCGGGGGASARETEHLNAAPEEQKSLGTAAGF
jgi:Zn-finger protein